MSLCAHYALLATKKKDAAASYNFAVLDDKASVSWTNVFRQQVPKVNEATRLSQWLTKFGFAQYIRGLTFTNRKEAKAVSLALEYALSGCIVANMATKIENVRFVAARQEDVQAATRVLSPRGECNMYQNQTETKSLFGGVEYDFDRQRHLRAEMGGGDILWEVRWVQIVVVVADLNKLKATLVEQMNRLTADFQLLLFNRTINLCCTQDVRLMAEAARGSGLKTLKSKLMDEDV